MKTNGKANNDNTEPDGEIWTQDKLANFYKVIYECIHDDGMTDEDTFMFEGQEYVIGYAKYLFIYLMTKFNEGPLQ